MRWPVRRTAQEREAIAAFRSILEANGVDPSRLTDRQVIAGMGRLAVIAQSPNPLVAFADAHATGDPVIDVLFRRAMTEADQ